LREKFNPRRINLMPAVKFFVRLDLDPIRLFLDEHQLMPTGKEAVSVPQPTSSECSAGQGFGDCGGAGAPGRNCRAGNNYPAGYHSSRLLPKPVDAAPVPSFGRQVA
jgi:hypothetical protein